ncbi:MAG: polyhydroxyalkanoate depolymerase [Rickettsiales bacterium]
MIQMHENSHLYHMHELQHAMLAPVHMFAEASKALHSHPMSPLSYTGYGRHIAAAAEVLERITDRYGKPEFGIKHTKIKDKRVEISEETIIEKPFCNLLHFKKATKTKQPKLLLLAPMSGHHATLLRGTVEALLPSADVYITDWLDARMVPLSAGSFDLEEYAHYVVEFIRHLGPDVHVMAVCQPSVPMLIAASVMSAEKDPKRPRSMTLIGGPIDTRINPTLVNKAAEDKPLSWFKSHVITRVPFNYPGFMRRVYPGFLQLTSFMSLDIDRHVNAHKDFFNHLVEGDGDSAAAHRKFYNEYLSVTDLPAEFYLDCIEKVFKDHHLPKGIFEFDGKKVDPGAIKDIALLTLEGELDDISGVGQTEAAQGLCKNLPPKLKKHHLQKGVGHYGIFNGRKFRKFVAPIIVDFINKHDK